MVQLHFSFVRSRAVALFTAMYFLVPLTGAARGEDPAAAPHGENTANAREPTLEERTDAYFRPRTDFAMAVEQAQKFAGPQALRVMLIVGDPKSNAARGLVDNLENGDKALYELLDDYEQLRVSTNDQEALDFLKSKLSLQPTQLKPVSLVVLNGDGRLLGVKKLPLTKSANDESYKAEIREFASVHALPRPDAGELLAAAKARARRENKVILLEESGTYCGWCRVLARFFDRHPNIFEASFVPLRIDRSRFAHGEEVMKRYRSTDGGIPWCALIDADGNKLSDWDMPDGNMGYPTLPKEFDYLAKILKQAVPKITDQQLAEMRADLELEAKKYEQH
jgi:Thioredoxin-like